MSSMNWRRHSRKNILVQKFPLPSVAAVLCRHRSRKALLLDLFFSAAESNMDALEEQGLIDAATRKDVLQNEIVLIAPREKQQ